MSHSNQSGLDRRDWIKVSAAGIAATAITGSTSAQSALAGPVNITKMSDPVTTRPLGPMPSEPGEHQDPPPQPDG